MTTQIDVHACCGDEKEVEVNVEEDGVSVELQFLQDDEKGIFYAHGNRKIIIEEKEK